MKIFVFSQKVKDLLGDNNISKFKLLFFLGATSSILEIIGVTSVLPFFSLILNPNYINDSQFISTVQNILNVPDEKVFTITIGILSLLIFVFGSTCMLINTIFQIKFANKLIKEVKNRLLEKYVNESFLDHKKNNSSYSISKIISQVDEVINGIVLCPLVIFTKLLGIMLLIIILFYFNFSITFSLIVFVSFTYFLILTIVKKRTDNASFVFFNSNIKTLQFANEALKLFKEIYFNKSKKFFLERFEIQTEEVLKAKNFIRLAPKISRYGLEIIAISSALIISLFLIYKFGTLNEYLPLLSFFVLASYKIFPNLNEIFGNIIQFKSQQESFKNLHYDLIKELKKKDLESKSNDKPIILKNSICLKNINFQYDNKKILNDINLKIKNNSKTILIGKTGSGKSTLADIIAGYLMPTSGVVEFDNININKDTKLIWQKSIGHVSQSVPILNDDLYINIALSNNFDKKQVLAAAKQAEIHEFIMNLDNKYETILSESGKNLSGGQIQRIGIARALYNDPNTVIFDEGTSNLDLITERKIFETLDKLSKEKTIIIITHRIETLLNFDKYFILKNGNIVNQGEKVSDLKVNYANFI